MYEGGSLVRIDDDVIGNRGIVENRQVGGCAARYSVTRLNAGDAAPTAIAGGVQQIRYGKTLVETHAFVQQVVQSQLAEGVIVVVEREAVQPHGQRHATAMHLADRRDAVPERKI